MRITNRPIASMAFANDGATIYTANADRACRNLSVSADYRAARIE
jgi:hypothetical protein